MGKRRPGLQKHGMYSLVNRTKKLPSENCILVLNILNFGTYVSTFEHMYGMKRELHVFKYGIKKLPVFVGPLSAI